MISQKSIEDIKNSVRLVDVVVERVNLQRRGSNFVGLCPFHSEKTPSFSVNETDNFYHCFGCGESGNVISWFMKTQGLSFPEALEYIAERYAITLQYDRQTFKKSLTDAGISKKDIYAVNMAAYKFFRKQLDLAPVIVKEYLAKRNLTQEVCDYFGIGYIPEAWDSLCTHLIARNFPQSTLLTAALAKPRKEVKAGIYDTFRARLIFPIWVDGRRIAGFGGRVIPGLVANEKVETPKYINSPETLVYQKNSIFYGLPQALDSMRQLKTAIVVEGYLDVISLQRVGISNVIATCGTALTTEHVKRLKSLVSKVSLLFDGDNAGRQAAAKSFKTFINSGLDVQVFFLPEKEDPDTIANNYSDQTSEYLAKLSKHSLLSCYVNMLLQQQGLAGFSDLAPASRGRFAQQLADIIKQVTNQVERNELLKEAAFLMKIEISQLEELLKSTSKNKPLLMQKSANTSQVKVFQGEGDQSNSIITHNLTKLEKDLLCAVMFLKNELPDKVLNDPMLAEELHPSIMEFVVNLNEIVNNSATESDVKKDAIKKLLTSFGADWTALWKSAYQMAANKNVDMQKMYDQCRLAIRKKKFEDAVGVAQRQIDETRDDELRTLLTAQKIELLRQLKSIAVSTT